MKWTEKFHEKIEDLKFKFEIELLKLKNKIKKQKDTQEKKKSIKGTSNKFKDLIFSVKKLTQKYDYDINRVIGVDKDSRYILYPDKKLIRIYRGDLKSKALLSSYVPIESAIFYNFIIEKNVLAKIAELDSFIETKVYEEAGLQETEEYLIKYKIVDKLQQNENALVQCVIVPRSVIEKSYEDIIQKVGYIDYLSFPAFAYKALYEENILKKGNDLFIVMLFDKIFLTLYTDGELTSINTISGGLNIVYESLKALKISNFDFDLFYKLLTKKGLDKNKYSKSERIVYERIKSEITNRLVLIQDEITKILDNFEISVIDRVFVTSEYGRIPGIEQFFKQYLKHDAFGFEFYEEYNLDRLAVNPFLFLGMLETHYAYKTQFFKYNYSLYLRPPTFFYRPSGQIVGTIILTIILLGIYPTYLAIDGFLYHKQTEKLKKRLKSVQKEEGRYRRLIRQLKDKISNLDREIEKYKTMIKKDQNFIDSLYKFKFSYIPKSQELIDITLLMNKHKIYLNKLDYKNGEFLLNVYSKESENIGKFIDDLINNGFAADFDKIIENSGKYYTNIRIEE